MKKMISLLLVLALSLTLAACGGAPAEDPTGTTAAEVTEATEAAATTEATEATEVTEGPSLRMPVNMELPALEDSTAGQEVEVPADAKFVNMAQDILSPNPIKGAAADPVDPYRPHYDLGTCGQLEGDPFFLCIFLDDYESSWNTYEAEAFLNDKFHPAMGWLVQQAAYWEAHLEYTAGYYATDADITVRYEGTVGDFNGGLNNDVLDQAATSLGFVSKEEMHQRMLEWSGKEQVAYVVILNKPGRSYAMTDWYNDDYDVMEYCVLFDEPSYVGDLVYDSPPSTVAHEVLHLFGAEDYYADGDQRVAREAIANYWFPDDVMLRSYYDISYNYVGAYTAYTVGWRDVSHAAAHEDGWWD